MLIMIIWIFALVFGIWSLIGTGECISEHIKHKGLKILTLFVAIPSVILFFLFIAFYPIKLMDDAPTEDILYSTHNIYSLEDNFNMNGRFFRFGGGYINEDLYYFVIIKQNYGDKVFKLNSNNTYLQQTDITPKIEYKGKRIINPILRILSIGSTYSELENKFQILYIPKDAVQIKYNIDLQ